MEPVRFADILFIVLTLLVIYLILYLVNKGKGEKKSSPGGMDAVAPSQPRQEVEPDKQQSS